MRFAVIILLLAGTTGCHVLAVLGNGEGLVCRADRACPSGMACVENRCRRSLQCEPRIAVGDDHACALLANCALKCWGLNTSGQLGQGHNGERGSDPSHLGASLPAVDLGPGLHAVDVAAGGAHSCALLAGGEVKCWGLNAGGQLGLGDTANRGDGPSEMGNALPAVDLGAGHTVTKIVAGRAHSCAMFDDGAIKCWGDNSSGQLGLGDSEPRGVDASEMGDRLPQIDLGAGFGAAAIAASWNETCARNPAGLLKCWGCNAYGQLGLGDTDNRGDELSEVATMTSIDLDAVGQVAVGGEHACALGANDAVHCWGSNNEYQLGLDSDTTDHLNIGDQPGEVPDTAQVNVGSAAITALTAGARHNCALLSDRRVKCWGSNDYGQLGFEDTTNRHEGLGNMGENLLPLDLGSGAQVAALAAGVDFSCALLTDNRVKCWGSNDNGRLGLGDDTYRGGAAGSMGDNLPAVNLGAP